MGVWGASIARNKGYSFGAWVFAGGICGFPVAATLRDIYPILDQYSAQHQLAVKRGNATAMLLPILTWIFLFMPGLAQWRSSSFPAKTIPPLSL